MRVQWVAMSHTLIQWYEYNEWRWALTNSVILVQWEAMSQHINSVKLVQWVAMIQHTNLVILIQWVAMSQHTNSVTLVQWVAMRHTNLVV